MSDWRSVNAVAFVLVYVALSVICCADQSIGQLLRNGCCRIRFARAQQVRGRRCGVGGTPLLVLVGTIQLLRFSGNFGQERGGGIERRQLRRFGDRKLANEVVTEVGGGPAALRGALRE
jgi:hypothetical protein